MATRKFATNAKRTTSAARKTRRARGSSRTRITATTSTRAASASRQRPERVRRQGEGRVTSRKHREPSLTEAFRGWWPNPDPTLFGKREGIALYARILRQCPKVAGYCRAWVDHVLVTERSVRAAKAATPELQAKADAAAERMARAWAQVQNQAVVLPQMLMSRFFGFARIEMVWRYDDVVKEWIPEIYDVDQRYWLFDDDGRPYLVTATNPNGVLMDETRFMRCQWGTADTEYGLGDLSFVYTDIWKSQKLDELALRRIEDSDPCVIVHVPADMDPTARKNLEDSYEEDYQKVTIVPSNEMLVRTEIPNLSVTTSGTAARQEYEGIQQYDTAIQTFLLGAPQTGSKQLGTGKVEGIRQEVWSDKTPQGSAALDRWLNEGWRQAYCDVNLADLPRELRPVFSSDSTEITQGLSGIAAQIATNIAIQLGAGQITATVAIDLWTAIGIAPARAKAMADSTVKERATLNPATPPAPPAEPNQNDELKEAA